MRLVRPLDRRALAAIPTVDGKCCIAGPYEFEDLLHEPEEQFEEAFDSRTIGVLESEGSAVRSACIEVTQKHVLKTLNITWFDPGRIEFQRRYLYRDSPGAPIEGCVSLHVAVKLHADFQGFRTEYQKKIGEVYVRPASRGRAIARVLLAEVVGDEPDVEVGPNFSRDGARLFGFGPDGRRIPPGGDI